MTLLEYVKLFRRGWLVVVALTVLGVGAANLFTLVSPSTYSSTASVFVALRNSGDPGALQQAMGATKDRAPSYASLATSQVVLEDAAATAGTSVEELRTRVFAGAREGEAYLDITAQAGTAQEAQARAQAVAEALSRQVPVTDTPGTTTPSLVLDIVTPAVLPKAPLSPRPRNNTFFGAVIGLALGVGVVVVAHALDSRIRNASDLPRGLRLATVTSLPAARTRIGRSQAGDLRLESFRHLRANLQFGDEIGGVMAVAGVTSASKTQEVVSQLAAVLGEIELAVVVVDVDLRTSAGGAQGEARPVSPSPGVADVLGGTARIEEVLSVGPDSFWTIPAGAVGSSSAQQLSTSSMREMLSTLSERFDYVLLSGPPVVERSEASVVAALSRSSLLVVESGETTRAEVLYALELLEGVGVTSVSLALDHVRGLDLGHTPLPAFDSTARHATPTR